MLKYIISPYYWTKALSAYEISDYLNTSHYLSKIDQKIVAKNYKYFLLRSLSSMYLREYQFALDMVITAEYILNKFYKNNISNDTYHYLIYYINHLKLSLNKLLKIPYGNKMQNNFNIQKVDRKVLHMFPIEIKND